jgi:hypothetical protein
LLSDLRFDLLSGFYGGGVYHMQFGDGCAVIEADLIEAASEKRAFSHNSNERRGDKVHGVTMNEPPLHQRPHGLLHAVSPSCRT